MNGRPIWLGSADVHNLLNRLVDRLDGAERRGSGKTQSIALTEKTWPPLFNAQFESRKEELWGHVIDMCQWGWLQVAPAQAIKSSSGYALSPRLTVLDESAVRRVVARPERSKSSVERWREAVEEALDAPAAVKRIVGDYCIDTPDHTMVEVVLQLNKLKSLAGRPMMLREVSSQLFWGMSKVLDSRQGLVATLLGLDECPFPEAPVQLQVFLPASGFRSVLFIENQMSFEQALRSRSGQFDGLAIVFASGFKGSAQRLRSSDGASLFYSSKGVLGGTQAAKFEEWLYEDGCNATNAHFWGDLDFSGMRILSAMRRSFPTLSAWQPGYGPMLDKLLDGQGHSPEGADKLGQAAVLSTGCQYADQHLIPAMAKMRAFVDQEVFTL